ncbi:hypothetical protein [Microcoleus sp. PH2017_22_RUC_O_B]|uniref:hypothetical protein n=1 Tax=Microcoleus sp. PH2017_22_RUC_O_B TaxID=2798833 RepID=UPI0025E69752|nr:hypothetical protein [Microcoleus sp. PH2017_22_RUC_O_B]
MPKTDNLVNLPPPHPITEILSIGDDFCAKNPMICDAVGAGSPTIIAQNRQSAKPAPAPPDYR